MRYFLILFSFFVNNNCYRPFSLILCPFHRAVNELGSMQLQYFKVTPILHVGSRSPGREYFSKSHQILFVVHGWCFFALDFWCKYEVNIISDMAITRSPFGVTCLNKSNLLDLFYPFTGNPLNWCGWLAGILCGKYWVSTIDWLRPSVDPKWTVISKSLQSCLPILRTDLISGHVLEIYVMKNGFLFFCILVLKPQKCSDTVCN